MKDFVLAKLAFASISNLSQFLFKLFASSKIANQSLLKVINSKKAFLLIFPPLVFLSTISQAASVSLVAEGEQTFYTVNSMTGNVSEIGSSDYLTAMDYSHDNTLFGGLSSLYTINPANGSRTTIGALPESLSSLAFDLSDRLYGLSSSSGAKTLWEIDPNTGGALSGTFLSGPGSNTRAMDFGPDGLLYSHYSGNLYTIDTATGATSLFKNISGGPTLLNSMDYGSDGLIRGYNTSDNSGLYQIDPATGVSSFIGLATDTPPAIRINSIASAPAVPIPAAGWLFGSGLIGLLGIRRIVE